jgi:lipopolysaccharide export system permease protein
VLTTFDRYLLYRYLYVVAGMFLAAWGLYVIVDGFTNIDIRGSAEKSGPIAMLVQLGTYYLFQSTMIFDLVGPTIAVMAIMIVLALMLRQGEVHPVLAAGVPTYRLVWPFFVGLLLMNGLMIANQELIIPQIADQLQGPRGDSGKTNTRKVEPQYDAHYRVFVSGQELLLGERRVRKAEFRLLSSVSTGRETLQAQDAINVPASGDKPAGWLLKNVKPAPEQLRLTEEGKRLISTQKNGRDLFVETDLSIEQLFRQNTAHKYLSTPELVTRIQHPGSHSASIRGQIMQVHSRLTRPLLTIIGLFMAFPLVIRKDRDSLIGNISVCMASLGVVFGLWQGGQFVGQSGFMTPELAAWCPLVFGGSLCTWLSGVLRT